jgi:hypothetical protein
MAAGAFGASELGRERLRITDGNELRAEPINERIEIESRTMATPLSLTVGIYGEVASLEGG